MTRDDAHRDYLVLLCRSYRAALGCRECGGATNKRLIRARRRWGLWALRNVMDL